MNAIGYRNPHFPASIVQHAIWLYGRFNLSLRHVEELMAEALLAGRGGLGLGRFRRRCFGGRQVAPDRAEGRTCGCACIASTQGHALTLPAVVHEIGRDKP